jgi:hypothetical protein
MEIVLETDGRIRIVPVETPAKKQVDAGDSIRL